MNALLRLVSLDGIYIKTGRFYIYTRGGQNKLRALETHSGGSLNNQKRATKKKKNKDKRINEKRKERCNYVNFQIKITKHESTVSIEEHASFANIAGSLSLKKRGYLLDFDFLVSIRQVQNRVKRFERIKLMESRRRTRERKGKDPAWILIFRRHLLPHLFSKKKRSSRARGDERMRRRVRGGLFHRFNSCHDSRLIKLISSKCRLNIN